MKGFFPENVSEYTKEQCNQYLAQYPESLQADAVRERLKVLTDSAASKPEKPQPPEKVGDALQEGKESNPTGFEGWSDFSKGLFTVGMIALAILLYVWTGWKLGAVASIVCLRSIYSVWSSELK